MDRKQRVIFKDDTVISDLSASLNDYSAGNATVAIVAADDAIYIGSELPFNHKFIQVATPNSIASTISAHIWNGSDWSQVADLVDQTAVGGKTLAQSGKISFTPNRDIAGWVCEYDSARVEGLETTKIYDLYWLRLTFSADLSATTALAYVGNLFNTDASLYLQYPDLNSAAILAAFGNSTTWIKQSLTAAEIIVQDLRNAKVLIRRDQIMDDTLLTIAGVHKTAQLIYMGLGNGHTTQRDYAERLYKASRDVRFQEIDRRAMGIATQTDKNFEQGYLYR